MASLKIQEKEICNKSNLHKKSAKKQELGSAFLSNVVKKVYLLK